MKVISSCILFIYLLFGNACTFSQKHQETKSTANQLYDLLQKDHTFALAPLDDQSRTDWTYLPGSSRGLAIKNMNETTKSLVKNLLNEFLSEQGYQKTFDIIKLEDVLRELEGRPKNDAYRNAGKYYFKMYGQPDKKSPWGISFEGHHLSLNFTVKENKISATPAFMGANPADVPSGKHKGWKVLEKEEMIAKKLINSMDESQLKQAVFSSAVPRDIISGTRREIDVSAMEGISYSALNENQQAILRNLLSVYINNLDQTHAKQQWKKIENWGYESIYFAWAGKLENGAPHYYKIMGPTLLIEYDNIQNNANHIHTVWRDSASDFGRDLLKEHYQKSPHHQKD